MDYFDKIRIYYEETRLLSGKLLSERNREKKAYDLLEELEFKVFSQWGDDGIIQYLIHHLTITNKIFVEFGVGDYRESNTRFLMMNNNWSGLVMDSSEENVQKIIASEYYWKYDLEAKQAFVGCNNVNSLIYESGIKGEIGLLHIDVDGVDYWLWDAIDVIKPVIVIMEYNSVFGAERSITVPYSEKFNRKDRHYSHLYFGASLKALYNLGKQKGYAFIGCNSAGNNAFFVQKDKLKDGVSEISLTEGFVKSKFRESRDHNGRLSFLRGNDRLKCMVGLEVYNTEMEQLESL
jgi:hypothetical protein